MHLRVTAVTSIPVDRIGEAAGGQDDTNGCALAAHPGKSQGRPPTNTGSKPIEQQRPAQPRLLPDAPVPDGRTVLTTPDAHRRPRRSLGTGSTYRPSYRLPTGPSPCSCPS